MMISNWGQRLAWYSCLVIGGFAFGQQSLAHEHEKMCGGIKDGDGEPVVQNDGDIVLYAGSSPCPDDPSAAVEPAVTTPGPVTGTIYFDFDEAEPNADGQAALAALIDALSAGTLSSVSVEGHADRAGSEAYNLGLSRQRADNVADALMDAGIPANTVSTEALGESAPTVPTEDGIREPANRHAEVETQF